MIIILQQNLESKYYFINCIADNSKHTLKDYENLMNGSLDNLVRSTLINI